MEIRTATANDNGNISEMMHSSGVELYNFIFNTTDKTAIDFIRHEFKSGQGFCGYKNVTVVIEDGRVIATGCFFDGNIFSKLSMGTVKNIFSFYGIFKAWPVLARARHTGSVMRTPRRNEIYLSNFGVNPEHRGSGIGSKLMAHQRKAAKDNGYQYLSLDVADNNPRAETLYTRMGFKVTREKAFTGKDKNMPKSKEMVLAL